MERGGGMTMSDSQAPAVRLAATTAMMQCGGEAEKRYPFHEDYQGHKMENPDAPGLLVSYYYLEPFLKNQHRYRYRDWVMDSGAFSAHNSGKTISLSKYVDCCLDLMSKDKSLTEVFALDVIGDPDASLKNTEEMWRQGVSAIPCFHQGEPEEHLYHMAKEYPKVALGGVALERGDFKLAWLAQCFARVWPKKIHGFGMAGENIVYNLPFHSVDATNWEIAPCAFGNWQKFGAMSVRGSSQDLRSQVKHYLALEAKARVRWQKQMTELDGLPEVSPTVRLVANAHQGREEAKVQALGGTPTVRLAVAIAQGGDNGANGERIAYPHPDVRLSMARPEKTGVTSDRTAEALSEPKKKQVEPTGELDTKWVDYWKNRKF